MVESINLSIDYVPVKKYDDLKKQYKTLYERIKELEGQLDDYHNAEKFVLGDDCPTDEVHCGCVMILKKQIKEFEVVIERQEETIKRQGKSCEDRHNIICGVKEVIDEYFEKALKG